MDVVAPLIANRESAVVGKPGKCALHNPSVSSQLLAALYALSCYTALYPAPSQGSLALLVIVGLVGVKLLGPLPWSAPRGRLMVSIVSISSSKTIESWTFAALSITQSGMPLRSETRWRLEPAFPLSVGFAPVFGPPFWPGCSPNPNKRTPTLSGRLRQDDPRAPGAAASRPLPPATHASVAST
jgi:hypothetical protein